MRFWSLLVLGACGPDPDTALRETVMEAVATEVALGQIKDFEAKSKLMADAAADYCAQPDSLEQLSAVRNAWWEAKGAMKRFEIIQFGPIVEYPERIGPKLDDWPVNASAVEDLIEGEAALAVDDFSRMGTATRGMPVVEYLLWSRGDDSSAFFSGSTRACEALIGSSGDVSRSSALLTEVWSEQWVGRLTDPADHPDDAYASSHDVLEEWVSRMSFTVENIRKDKLGKPVGDAAGGEPQPDILESRYSQRSLEDAVDALLGVLDVWSGGEWSERGVLDLLEEDWDGLASTTSLFEVSLQRTREIPEPLEQTINDEPEIVARAQEALLALQVALQVDLAQALSVQVGFNDNDGD